MKKEYISPEFELIRITLSDVLNSSPVTEDPSGGFDTGDNPIDSGEPINNFDDAVLF